MLQTMMTPEGRFNYALEFLLQDEGGYSNDADDLGGETNSGITQRELDKVHVQLGISAYVKDLTDDEIAIYYKACWWDKYNYNAIENLIIAAKIFDLAVNMGAEAAHKILQQALTYVGYSTLKIDGILGINTICAINETCFHGRMGDLLDEIRDAAKWHYEQLVEENPELNKFLKGWLNRAAR